ncbi:MAG: hypothetical protein ACRD2J_06065 [Thermoanaerobaculia bacterium]
MAKDRHNQGGPTRNPKDEPTADRDNRVSSGRRAQAQSAPIGDEERHARASDRGEQLGHGRGKRTGSDSNRSKKGRGW